MRSLLVCLLGLLVSVQASPVSPPVISGHVRLPDGLPVAGAQVVLFDVADLSRGAVGQATTDETGQFALPLAAGGALCWGSGWRRWWMAKGRGRIGRGGMARMRWVVLRLRGSTSTA